MKLSKSGFAGLIFILSLCFFIPNAEAGFSNSGRMQTKNLNLSVGGVLENNGELVGTESATLSCDTLTGKGLISSPQITLRAKQFSYTGTIDCSGKCTITSATAINKKSFKQTGKGEFVFIVNPNM